MALTRGEGKGIKMFKKAAAEVCNVLISPQLGQEDIFRTKEDFC